MSRCQTCGVETKGEFCTKHNKKQSKLGDFVTETLMLGDVVIDLLPN